MFSLGNKKALQSVRLELLAVGLVCTSFFLVIYFLLLFLFGFFFNAGQFIAKHKSLRNNFNRAFIPRLFSYKGPFV
jgi:hypothetical protein